jgi:hypothetical protein
MKQGSVKLKRIISIASANGYWAKVHNTDDLEGPFEFWPLGFWLAGEFEWDNGTRHEQVIPVPSIDAVYVNSLNSESTYLADHFNYSVYHDSQFEIIGEKLKAGVV